MSIQEVTMTYLQYLLVTVNKNLHSTKFPWVIFEEKKELDYHERGY